MFACNSTKKSQILAPAATWQIKIKITAFFNENYIHNIILQRIA